MLITVIICTRNRARQLANVLQTFVALKPLEDASWEMLIVDNGSTDDTAAVIESFSDRLPLRRIHEPEAGLSNARNAGVRAAAGEYICWTDDDVEVDPEWLSSYARAFRRYPDVKIFGGLVEPVFEGSPPKWMTDNPALFAGLLAKRDFGPIEKRTTATMTDLPFGANFAVRAKEQKQQIYDANLGVSPKHKRLGEETCVLLAIAADGGEQVWVPGSRVRHLIPASRMTLSYVQVYNQSMGETWAYLSEANGPGIMGAPIPAGGRRFNNVPIWVIRAGAKAALRYRIKRFMGKPPAEWLDDMIAWSRFAGAQNYFRKTSRNGAD